ncbi:cob(I)yrinic acid a,c-diamide adenosyltransferase [Thermodesulforhabdus norvegica]|uniref:Corrinoid adenosyltransferase n=1 Tax=Thermodesulforhabdus norvegica TaxID=39841 RepID=A0A1I4THA6_9BACT|nr:cob(I)yrinic acid a,c-diamide adenosyltransferase [Thermodesulforhabdus norvegica]SFM75930.1 cob(I)alamin adenosyltransferase [Thermodesulforhabdus norvegica]
MERPSQGKEIFVFSKKGDSGETSLLSGERVPKHHIRPETYGTIDEASSALGIARALTGLSELKSTITEIQQDLVVLGAELACSDRNSRYRITEEHISRLERWIEKFQEQVTLPRRFVLPGDSLTGAVLDLARTIVRRAERRCSELRERGEFIRKEVPAFLNRLADLLFVMARYADALEKAE